MNIVSSITKSYKLITESAKSGREVAKRAASIHGASKAETTIAKGRGAISGALSPVLSGVTSVSDTFGTVSKTSKQIGRNIRKTKSRNSGKGLKSTIEGIKNSAPEIKTALKDIAGVNDIKAATEAGGAAKGVVEAGKAITRLVSTLALAAAGTVAPIPGGSVLGWVAGEKIATTCLGKPFTKQAKKLIG